MKRLIPLLLSLFLIAADRTPQDAYIEKYSAIAVSEMERSGVPASITLAQGLVESRAGQSALAVEGNNHFGIKCHNDWKGKKMYHDDDKRGECFRVYPTAEQSFRDHSDFLRFKDRYKGLFELDPRDYKGWARGLKKAGYATDPSYASKLIKVIEDYGLYRFDGKDGEEGTTVVVPEAPLVIEAPQKIDPVKHGQQFREEVKLSLTRDVMVQNGVPFIISIKGETYESIASARGLFLKELLYYNDLKAEEPLEPGTAVYVQIKKKKAAKGVDKYVIDHDGESLREIAQRFAVRLSSIRKLNSLPEDYVPGEGDTILLR